MNLAWLLNWDSCIALDLAEDGHPALIPRATARPATVKLSRLPSSGRNCLTMLSLVVLVPHARRREGSCSTTKM